MEVELARAKLDLMNLDRQLMDAIQQKLQLSQQLEQWQVSCLDNGCHDNSSWLSHAERSWCNQFLFYSVLT